MPWRNPDQALPAGPANGRHHGGDRDHRIHGHYQPEAVAAGGHRKEPHGSRPRYERMIIRLTFLPGLVLLFGVGLLLGYIAAERVTCF